MLTATHTHNDLFKTGAGSMQTIRQHQSKVVFSALSEFYAPVDAEGFSIKYVLDGTEVYHLNKEQYIVGPGSYLLSNSSKTGNVEIESRNTVKGICITIAPEIVTEAAAGYCRPDSCYSDADLGSFLTTTSFPEDIYHDSETALGKTLHTLAGSLNGEVLSNSDFTMEFFYSLTEKIIEDQLPVFRQLQNITSVKANTKKELYKNIKRGRAFMDACFTADVQVQQVAREARMSEFHFYRLFKEIMGITPHQYILQKRLTHAQHLLQQQMPVTEAAAECGFSDIFSFSKAFKKQFGFPPSQLLKK
jgi:AraC family transcriptional regulator